MSLELCPPVLRWQLPGRFLVLLCNLIAAIGCFVFIFAILYKKSTRNNTFNLYVVFLIFPDGFSTLISVIHTAMNFKFGYCDLPDWYWYSANFVRVFYFFSNFYLNCCVAYEIYGMVEGSNRLRRTRAPRKRRVFVQVGVVYSLSILLATWTVLDVSWSYYDTQNLSFGSPTDDGLFSPLAAIIFLGTLSLIPILFVIGLRCRIWSTKLMQNEGRTRTLYLFFERITFVFIGMYVPGIVLTFALSALEENLVIYYWVARIVDLIRALQALITLILVSYKEDIWKAVVACSCFSAGDTTDDEVKKPETEQSDPDATNSTLRGNESSSLRTPSSPFGGRSGTFKSISTPFSASGTERSETLKTLAGLFRTDESVREANEKPGTSRGSSSVELGEGDHHDPATEPPEEPNAEEKIHGAHRDGLSVELGVEGDHDPATEPPEEPKADGANDDSLPQP